MKNLAEDFGHTALPVLSCDTAPNPARVRPQTLVLDGVWTLTVNGELAGPVVVPFPPQAKINGIAIPEGEVELVYRTTLELPVEWEGGVLHFEGVDHESEVTLNGQLLGRHAGAYDPFSFVVPRDLLRQGIQSDAMRLHALEVVVRDSSDRRTVICGKQERVPREGNIFYGNMSGLWKSVWIERAGEVRIEDFRITAAASGRLSVAIDLAGHSEGYDIVLALRHEEDEADLEMRVPVVAGQASIELVVDNVRPWSVDCPSLYVASLSLLDPRSRQVDRIETYVGFRDIAMRDGYVRLNGQPFQFQGLLNQAIYPDTLYTPTDRHTLTDYEHTRAEGFNGERRHQTTPRHRDLWLADRMGYWLSIELPAARNLLDPADRAAAIDEWRRIVRAYAWNHPSVFFLVPGNENWGLLTHPHHEVDATDEDREAFQYELGAATEAVAPPDMPYAANDGWKLVTSRRKGRHNPGLDASRLMFNVHDYSSTAQLRSTYGALRRFPRAGTWGRNRKHVFHSADYGYDGVTPMILSEAGGRALLNRTSKGVFAYGKIHRDPDAWAEEVAELIRLLGELPILRGGYVLTQTRDAGNDPEDDSSLGELNGILDGRGLPKSAGTQIREANRAARDAWARGIAEEAAHKVRPASPPASAPAPWAGQDPQEAPAPLS